MCLSHQDYIYLSLNLARLLLNAFVSRFRGAAAQPLRSLSTFEKLRCTHEVSYRHHQTLQAR